MKKLPLVSIIIPLYNAQNYLESMFAQLDCQTMQDFEAVIINDGSQDNTAQIIRERMQHDARLRLFEQDNCGIGAARNTGLAQARGSYITFLDADDMLHPRYVEALYQAADAADADISICQIEHLDDTTGLIAASPDRFPAHAYPKVFTPTEHADDLFGSFRTLAQAKMYRRSFVEEQGLQFAPLYRTDDLAYTAAALASARRIALVDEDLYTYRVNNPHSSTSTRAAFPLDFFESCKRLKQHLEQHSLMDTYRKTYTQWVGLSCMLNLLELRDIRAYSQVYQLLHNGGLKTLGLNEPRPHWSAQGRKSASGAILDTDIEKALSIIEKENEAAGTIKLLALAAHIKARKAQAGPQTPAVTAGTPAISVLIPVYNAEKYLKRCLDSVLDQSLRSIEVICVDDGSTDQSSSILDSYAQRDDRMRVIHKSNTGYGDSMNAALREAHGIYVAICEPDDYLARRMLDALWKNAWKQHCDMVKSNYYELHTDNTPPSLIAYLDPYPYDTCFVLDAQPELLFAAPTIWTGIYRRQMLLDANVTFTPSPGASFQDLSFSHQCLFAAQSIYLTRQAYYHYRIDNDSSSSNSLEKVDAVCQEYEHSFAALKTLAAERQHALTPWLNAARMGNYLWNYNRIAPEYHLPFAHKWAAEMAAEIEQGRVDEGILTLGYRTLLRELLESPAAFCEKHPLEIERPPIM